MANRVGRPKSTGDPNALTPREKQVASLVATGLENRIIGEQLGCSIETVKRHLKRISEKRGLSNRTEVAIWWHVRSKQGELRQLQEQISAAEQRLAELQLDQCVISRRA